jgi:hypothetical protein
MGLVKDITIAVVVLIVIFGIAFLFAHKQSSGTLSESQAMANVTKDLSETYLGANITILNISELGNGNYSFIVRLLFNGTRACPTIYTNTYIYPGFTFVPIRYNSYVPGRIGCTQPNGKPNQIASPYIAIGWATNQSIPLLTYLNDYGYDNVSVKAKPYNATGTWIVNYTADMANASSWCVALSENGALASQGYC